MINFFIRALVNHFVNLIYVLSIFKYTKNYKKIRIHTEYSSLTCKFTVKFKYNTYYNLLGIVSTVKALLKEFSDSNVLMFY